MFIGELVTTIASAVEATDSQLKGTETLELTFVVALVFSAIHIWSESLHRFLYKSEEIAASFGGGMAIAYVFMHLLPELEKGNQLLGVGVNFITLIGFLLFYGMQRLAWKSKLQGHSTSNLIFYLKLLFACLYNGLLIYAIPEQFDQSWPFVILYLLAMSLHLIGGDHSLSEEHNHEFKSWGRYLLVAAVIAALVIDIFTDPANELVSDVLTAILAGSLMFNIFKEELPTPENSSFLWFGTGVAFYLVLLAGSWAMVS